MPRRCLFKATKPFLPFLGALAGEVRDPAAALRAPTPDGYTAEAEAGTYEDVEDAYRCPRRRCRRRRSSPPAKGFATKRTLPCQFWSQAPKTAHSVLEQR